MSVGGVGGGMTREGRGTVPVHESKVARSTGVCSQRVQVYDEELKNFLKGEGSRQVRQSFLFIWQTFNFRKEAVISGCLEVLLSYQ